MPRCNLHEINMAREEVSLKKMHGQEMKHTLVRENVLSSAGGSP